MQNSIEKIFQIHGNEVEKEYFKVCKYQVMTSQQR